MRFHSLVRKTVLVGLFLSFAHPALSDDIYLPAEYFSGRWAKGHNGLYRETFSKTEDPRPWVNYGFASQTFRGGLENIQDYILYGTGGGKKGTPYAYFHVRPISRWQFGLDHLHYLEIDESTSPTPTRPQSTAKEERYFRMFLSSSWANSDSVLIASGIAPYNYYVDRFVGRGVILVDNAFRLYVDRVYAESARSYGFRTEREKHWSANSENRILWGITSSLNLQFDVGFRFATDYSKDIYVTCSEYDERFKEEKELYPWYRALLLSRVFHQIFFTGSFEQWYLRAEDERLSHRIDDDGDVSSWQLDDVDKLQELWKRFRLGAHYISTGAFDSRIVLDDYSGYYRRMLFHRQVKVSGDFYYREYGFPGAIPKKYGDLSASVAVGLLNKLELSSTAVYAVVRTPRNRTGTYFKRSESLNYSFTMRYRSYIFQPNAGPGWYRDTKYDIAFRPLLRPAAVYAELTITPPGLSKTEYGDLELISLDRLTGDDSLSLVGSVSAGIGYEAEVSLAGDLRYYDSDLVYRYLSLSGRKRLLGKTEAFFEIHNIYRDEAENDHEVVVGFRALL